MGNYMLKSVVRRIIFAQLLNLWNDEEQWRWGDMFVTKPRLYLHLYESDTHTTSLWSFWSLCGVDCRGVSHTFSATGSSLSLQWECFLGGELFDTEKLPPSGSDFLNSINHTSCLQGPPFEFCGSMLSQMRPFLYWHLYAQGHRRVMWCTGLMTV